jgi:hypothetical protein
MSEIRPLMWTLGVSLANAISFFRVVKLGVFSATSSSGVCLIHIRIFWRSRSGSGWFYLKQAKSEDLSFGPGLFR